MADKQKDIEPKRGFTTFGQLKKRIGDSWDDAQIYLSCNGALEQVLGVSLRENCDGKTVVVFHDRRI